MIENYLLMHKGGLNEYTDSIFVNYASTLTMVVVYTPQDTKMSLIEEANVKGLIQSSSKMKFEEVSRMLSPILETKNYMFIRVNDKEIITERHGKVYAYMVKNGELLMLPNGKFSLEDEDRIICYTEEFRKQITELQILADAITCDNTEEWMDNMICRISDKNRLSEGNLTAVTMIVRSGDDMKTYGKS